MRGGGGVRGEGGRVGSRGGWLVCVWGEGGREGGEGDGGRSRRRRVRRLTDQCGIIGGGGGGSRGGRVRNWTRTDRQTDERSGRRAEK